MQRGSLQFSVTQPDFIERFGLRPQPMIPGTDVMSGSVINEQIKNIIDQASGINKALSPQQQLQLYLDQKIVHYFQKQLQNRLQQHRFR